MEQVPPSRLGYLAGFIDGEGCICMLKSGQKIRVVLTATNKDVRPLVLLRETFGGTIYWRDRETAHEVAQWVISGHPAAEALMALHPHLIVKREQCELGLSFFGALDNPVRQEEMRQAMRALNSRERLRTTNDPHRTPLLPTGPDRTHCRRGHVLDEENTYRGAKGDRRCRRCNRESQQRHRDRRRMRKN